MCVVDNTTQSSSDNLTSYSPIITAIGEKKEIKSRENGNKVLTLSIDRHPQRSQQLKHHRRHWRHGEWKNFLQQILLEQDRLVSS